MIDCRYMRIEKPMGVLGWGVQVFVGGVVGYLALEPMWRQTFLAGGRTMSYGVGLLLTLLVLAPIWLLQFLALRTSIRSTALRWVMMITAYAWGMSPIAVLAWSWSKRFAQVPWKRWGVTALFWVLAMAVFWFLYMLLGAAIIFQIPLD